MMKRTELQSFLFVFSYHLAESLCMAVSLWAAVDFFYIHICRSDFFYIHICRVRCEYVYIRIYRGESQEADLFKNAVLS